MKELKTIKVLPETIEKLNVIAALKKENQYEVVERLATTEAKKLIKTKK